MSNFVASSECVTLPYVDKLSTLRCGNGYVVFECTCRSMAQPRKCEIVD